MIDLHCHILPFLDDGPKSFDESITMVKQAISDGIHTLVATPHHLDGLFLNSRKQIANHIEMLKNRLENENIDITILQGMEVHLCKTIWQYFESGEAFGINHTPYVLLELPGQSIPPQLKNEIFELQVRGYKPIIAHPERNLVIQTHEVIIYDLVSWGVFVQITASSLFGFYGPIAQKCAKLYLKNRIAHLIASDAHSPDNRPPLLSDAVDYAARVLKDSNEALEMVNKRPEAIIAGQPIDCPEPLKSKKGIAKWFSFR